MSRLTTIGMNSNQTLNKGANYSSIFYFTEVISSWPANTSYSLYDRAVAQGYRGQQLVADITINSGVVIDGFTFFSLMYTYPVVKSFALNGVNSSITITNNGTIRGFGGSGRYGSGWVAQSSSTGSGQVSGHFDWTVEGIYGATGVLKVFSNASGGNGIDIGLRVLNTSGGSTTPVPILITGTGYIYGGGGGGGGGSVSIGYVKESGITNPFYEFQTGGGGGGGKGNNNGTSFGIGQVSNRGQGGVGGVNGIVGFSYNTIGASGVSGNTSSAGTGGAGGVGPSNNLGSGHAGAGGNGGDWGTAGSAGADGVNGSNVTNVSLTPGTYQFYTSGGAGGFAVMVWAKNRNGVDSVNVSYGGSIVANSLGGFGSTSEVGGASGATGVSGGVNGSTGATGPIVGATSSLNPYWYLW